MGFNTDSADICIIPFLREEARLKRSSFFAFDVAKRSLAEWEESVAPNLTFGSLARFIADRAPAIASFDPILLLGRPCAPAGVFTGIQFVANKTTGRQLRFAPSTRIIEGLRGHDLDGFWTQLRWMTEHAAPDLPAFWRGVTGVTGGFGIFPAIAAVIAALVTSNYTWLIPTFLLALMSYMIAMAYKRFKNPLPSDLVNFRDLSTLIATRRS